MALRSRLAALALLVVGVGAAGCQAGATAEDEQAQPATVEAVEGTDLNRVTLTEEGAGRLGIRTAAVAPAAGAGAARSTVPFPAVLYDAEGRSWVYQTAGVNVFVRAPIVVDRVDGDTAYLRQGPAAGTVVVTVGVPELYGAEYGVGGE